MWCKHCRQDVPAVPVASGSRVCMRCGTAADASTAAHTIGVKELAAHGVDLGDAEKPSPRKPPIEIDEWELESDYRHVRELVELAAQNSTGRAKAVRPRSTQPIVSAPIPVAAIAGNYAPRPVPAESRRRQPQRAGSVLAWFCLSLGLISFVCGVVLMIWSFTDGQAALWSLGMPITVVGQAGLILGLVLQLERIGQGTRYASDQLDKVDEQLTNLRQTTNLLSVTHGSAAQAFYAHMAEGASPNLLLADLKGQLDLLAVRMAQR